ncbi:Putative EGF-like domain-containing protein [Colletotrichum destructivum]|uniref:EGF-like domain-containing protein n=1 Tax=Colletotrichum destructivum TaxID=34406 RepID=A0AAX4IUX7_9PEZI|nr:Putative EGF-like domain-containing protein [Colletotrichum destructivum]
MQFLSTFILAMSAMFSLTAAGTIPPGDANTTFEAKNCGTGYASCGKAGTNGDAGSRCALECTYLGGPTSLGSCQCPKGFYVDTCISSSAHDGRTKC